MSALSMIAIMDDTYTLMHVPHPLGKNMINLWLSRGYGMFKEICSEDPTLDDKIVRIRKELPAKLTDHVASK